MTNTTVLPDIDELAESTVQPSVAPNAGDRQSLGAALLRLNGETPPATDHALNGATGAENDSESEDSDPTGDASNSDSQADENLPRRGASSIRELKAEIAELKTQIQQRPQDAPQPTEAEQRLQAALETVSTLKGSDEDWRDLKSRVVDGLSFDESERYRRMSAAREFEDEWNTLAEARAAQDFSKYRNGFFENLAGHFANVSTKAGVDAEFVRNNHDLGKVFDHIYEAGRQSLADENDQLRGEIKSLKANGLTTAPRLPTGGRTSLGLSNTPDPREAAPAEMMTAGIRQRARSQGRR